MGVEDDFRRLMEKADEVYRSIERDDPYVAQLMVPFAFKIPTLYSWSTGQNLFVSKLRSGEGGIISYRKVAWDIADEEKRIRPEFSRLLRVDRRVYPSELVNLGESKEWYNSFKRSEK